MSMIPFQGLSRAVAPFFLNTSPGWAEMQGGGQGGKGRELLLSVTVTRMLGVPAQDKTRLKWGFD